jgi:hypothetical protein
MFVAHWTFSHRDCAQYVRITSNADDGQECHFGSLAALSMETEPSTVTLSTLCPLMTNYRTIRRQFVFDRSTKFCIAAPDDVMRPESRIVQEV